MVQVPSIDADLRVRRRVRGLDDGDTVEVDVRDRDLSFLPSLSTVGELLSTSTTDVRDVLSNELSAGALSSSSSLRIAGVCSVLLESKDSKEGETGFDSPSCSASSSMPDKMGGDRGSPVSEISTVTSISGDLDPLESSLSKEDEGAAAEEDGAVADDDDEAAVIVVVEAAVVEEVIIAVEVAALEEDIVVVSM